MSSTDFVRILSAFDFPHSNPILTADSIQSRMWAPGNSAGWGESQIDSVISHGWGGVLPGLNSIVSHRADNVSFAIWWNKDIADSGFVFPEGSAEPKDHWVHWHEIIGDVTNWPSHDFFPDFGLGPPDGPRKHSGIFTPQPAERRYVWGSSMADLRARNTELFAKGFRMIHQQSFATWEGRRYDAMWAPGTDGRPIVWGWAFNDLKKRNDERVAGGWRMIHQQSYVTKDGRRYDAIWMPGTGPRPIVWGWTQQDLKIRNDELFNQGFRLIHQQSYEIPSGGRRYDAIWAPGTGPRPIVWGWTLKDLGARNHVLFGQGLRMIHQQAYYLGSELRYDAIWAPASDGRPITWEKQMPTFQARIESLDSAGYRMLHQHSVPNDPKDAYQDR